MTCRELADFILDYVENDLDEDIRARFDGHLTRCANCRRYLAAYRQTMSMGKVAFKDDDLDRDAAHSGAPEDLIAAILASRKSHDS